LKVPSLLWKTDLGEGRVLAAAARLSGEKWEVAAAQGSRVQIFTPADGDYLPLARLDLPGEVTGLAPVRAGAQENREYLAASTAENILLLGVRDGVTSVLAESGPEAGAGFADLAAGDLDGDGRDEIIAAAPGLGTLYVYSLLAETGGQLRLELLGIRAAPGTPLLVEALQRTEGSQSVALAFEQDGMSGLALYGLTERGFDAGPILEGLPYRITALAAGDFAPGPGGELALGGSGGMVWLVGADERLDVLLVTDSLGSTVSALAAAPGGDRSSLLAGTPGGYVFVFKHPAAKSPDLAFTIAEGVSSLAGVPGGRAAVGTSLGGIQVWSLDRESQAQRYIVGPGDSIWKIAGKFGVTVEQILAANENIKKPEMVMPGQVIRIPSL